MAALAVSANAQDKEIVVFTEGTTYSPGGTLTSTNTTLTIGANQSLKNDGKPALKSHKNYILGTGLSQKAMVDGEEKDRYLLMESNTNPTNYDADQAKEVPYTPSGKNLPDKGCYYVIKANVAGKILAGVVINSGKNFYVVKASNGEALPVSAVTLTNDADTPTTETYKDNYTTANKVTGTAEFAVEANESYYIFITGSKIGFFGYVFTPNGGTDGITSVKAAAEENAPAYNLAGQKVSDSYKGVVIKSGKKVVVK